MWEVWRWVPPRVCTRQNMVNALVRSVVETSKSSLRKVGFEMDLKG